MPDPSLSRRALGNPVGHPLRSRSPSRCARGYGFPCRGPQGRIPCTVSLTIRFTPGSPPLASFGVGGCLGFCHPVTFRHLHLLTTFYSVNMPKPKLRGSQKKVVPQICSRTLSGTRVNPTAQSRGEVRYTRVWGIPCMSVQVSLRFFNVFSSTSDSQERGWR